MLVFVNLTHLGLFLASHSFSAESCSARMLFLWIFLGYLRDWENVGLVFLHCGLYWIQDEFGDVLTSNVRTAKWDQVKPTCESFVLHALQACIQLGTSKYLSNYEHLLYEIF